MRRRVVWVKALASIFTLGTGGAGGREGPTMQIGGALGSLVGALLRRHRARAAHPARRRRRGRHLGGVPHAARRRAARGRGALSRRLRVRRADPGGPRQRRRLLGRHLDLRRVDAVRARAALSRSSRRTCRSTRCWRCWSRSLAALFLASLRVVQRVSAAAAGARLGAARARRPRARRCSACRSSCSSAAHRRAGAGARHPRRRLRRGADGDHRRDWLPERLGARVELLLLLVRAPRWSPSSLTIG